MNTINSRTGATYHMEAPEINADQGQTKKTIFPTSEVVSPSVTSNAASVAINREKTIVKLGTRTAATTLTLVPEAANLNVGAIVAVNWTSDGTARAITVKVGESTVATLTGTASTNVTKQLMWDGEAFLAI